MIHLTYGQAMLSALGALLLGVIGYMVVAAFDERGRKIDLYENKLDKAATDTGNLDAWAEIKNEIARPSTTPVSKMGTDLLFNTNFFRDKRGKYIILPLGYFSRMPAVWQARLTTLLDQAKEVMPTELPWPRYFVTIQGAQPPHQFLKEDPLG